MARHRVAAAGEVPVDSLRKVEAGGVELCLAHAEDGAFYCIGDLCTHEDFSLSEGEIWGLQVECPQHGSRFDLRDGSVTGFPAVVPARVYAVSVEDGDVYVEV